MTEIKEAREYFKIPVGSFHDSLSTLQVFFRSPAFHKLRHACTFQRIKNFSHLASRKRCLSGRNLWSRRTSSKACVVNHQMIKLCVLPENITQHVRQNRPSKPRRDTFSQIFWMEFPWSYGANGRPRRSESIHFSLRTDHNSFGTKFLKTLAEWIAPVVTSQTPLAP